MNQFVSYIVINPQCIWFNVNLLSNIMTLDEDCCCVLRLRETRWPLDVGHFNMGLRIMSLHIRGLCMMGLLNMGLHIIGLRIMGLLTWVF